MSGLGLDLEPAFRRGLGLGKFRLRSIKAGAGATALRYRIHGLRIGFAYYAGLVCDAWPFPRQPVPDHTIGGGGLGTPDA